MVGLIRTYQHHGGNVATSRARHAHPPTDPVNRIGRRREPYRTQTFCGGSKCPRPSLSCVRVPKWPRAYKAGSDPATVDTARRELG
jgi:hypothetical protein